MKNDIGIEDSDVFIARHRQVRGSDFNTNDIARASLPYLSELRRENAGVHTIVIGTGDGIHVCSIGLKSKEDAARLAALNASMLGSSRAQAMVVEPNRAGDGDTIVTVTMPDEESIALAKIDHAPVGHLVLCLFGRDMPLGMLVHHARTAAAALVEWLKEE